MGTVLYMGMLHAHASFIHSRACAPAWGPLPCRLPTASMWEHAEPHTLPPQLCVAAMHKSLSNV